MPLFRYVVGRLCWGSDMFFVFCGCCRISKVNDDQSPTTYDLKFMDGDWEENALAENLIVC